MQTHFSLFIMRSIIASFACLNLAAAPFSASSKNAAHICGVTEGQPDTRHYARSLANLDAGEPRTVRLIYFTPNDWPYRADVVQNMKDTIRIVQTFYAEQMEAHGYGRETFMVESDARGELIAHHVNGKHPFSHYDNTLGSEVFNELQEAFDFYANIYFIVLGTDVLRQSGGQPAGGVGYNRGKNGGTFLVPNQFSWLTVAHELGHGFGLGHDFRDNAHIMSYGYDKDRLSGCAAEFLSMHTYFNPDIPIEVGEPPTIELVSSRRYPPGSTSIPVRLQANDPEGVHQIQVFAHGGLQACRGLDGDNNAVAEFEYDGGFGQRGFTRLTESATHGISVEAVDTEGNVSRELLTLVEDSPGHIATLKGHTTQVRAVSFSNDTTTLVSIGETYLGSGETGDTISVEPTIKLWDVARRAEITTFGHHKSGISMTLSADGTTLATGGWEKVELWDVATRTHIATLEGHTNWVHSLAFSRDGRTLASGAQDHTVKLWDVATRQDIATFQHSGLVSSVAFSPDETILASGSDDRTVKLWDVERRQYITTLEGHWAGVTSVAFSRDGILASGSSDQTVKLWDVRAQQEIGTLQHKSSIKSVSFSPDGEILATGTASGSVELWSVLARAHLANLGNPGSVNSVAFSPDGTTLAAGIGFRVGTIELWDTSERRQLGPEVNIPGPYLRAAIAKAIGLPPNTPIVRGHMRALKHLEARNANITNLTGLEVATNLKTLDLGREYIEADNRSVNTNSVSDLSPLAGLINLTSLNIIDNDISDLSHLAGLSRLISLHINDNDITDISALAGLIGLKELYLGTNSILDISAVAGLTNLSSLSLWGNSISDISAVAGLTNLTLLSFGNNNISDLAPLVENAGFGSGDTAIITRNPLSYPSIYTHIPTLQERGVEVRFDNRTPHRIRIVSGNDQGGLPGTALDKPFIVEVLDERDAAFEGVPVTFTVTAGDGTLSTTNTATDANGRAESILTLGPNQGRNIITVSVPGTKEQRTFTADGIRIPKRLKIISGNDQEGLPGTALENPYVVEVRDQSDKPLPGVQVTFSVSSGGGTLSATSATTDANGRAQSTLTLGPTPGTNTVEVSASGTDQTVTFSLGQVVAAHIPDPNLRAAIAATLGKPQSASIGQRSMGELTALEARNANITDLTGLEGASNLNTLDLSSEYIEADNRLVNSNSVSDLFPLAGLTKLTYLDIRHNDISNISVVSGLTNLNTLFLGANSISDISAVARLTALRQLSLWGNSISGISAVAGLTNLTSLDLRGNSISDISAVTGLRNLTWLNLGGNSISGISAVAGLTNLTWMALYGNNISDISPLVENAGLGSGDRLIMTGNPLSYPSIYTHIPTLQERGVEVRFDNRVPQRIRIVSGNDQGGLPGTALDVPFVVEVQDQRGVAFEGVPVTFTVTAGDGKLSVSSTTANKNGMAQSRLMLGPNPGTNTVTVSVTGIQETQTVTAFAESPRIPEDVNRDDVVNILDLVSVASVLGEAGQDLMADVNGDGIVNILDLVLVAGALGNAAAAPSAWYRDLKRDFHGNSIAFAIHSLDPSLSTRSITPTRADMVRWLAQASEVDLTDPASRRGVLFLEQLLAALTPKETALLPNYPNPFNPETWIPYQLVQDAYVTLTIYDRNGAVVRRLDLGHQSAGFYESRSEAIYWDGCNKFGEGVASGVYLYRLSAGDFSAARKMLVVK